MSPELRKWSPAGLFFEVTPRSEVRHDSMRNSLEYKMFNLWMKWSGYIRKLPSWARLPFYLTMALLFLLVWMAASIPRMIWSLFRGVWYRYFPPPATRDISRLGGDDDGELDLVTETIEDEGKPLREHHRRLIRRDPRLLPKPQAPPDVWPRPRRKRVMRAHEARRLFAATMRTTNRKTRDLLADEDQLRRLGLPLWKREQDVAEALDIDVRRLRYFSIHREQDAICHYVQFQIPKRNGGRRVILAPKRQLKSLQQQLLRQLVDHLPLSDHAHGFRTGRSIRSGAEPHVGRQVVLKMDLQDFFPSVTFARVRGYLIALGYSFPVATTLAVLMTESERQPVEIEGRHYFVPVGQRYCVQGAPTSPGLCNSICRRLDQRLAGLTRKYDWSYTRYADDLTFSGDAAEHLVTIRRLAQHICREEGFQVHPEKTRIMRSGQRQRVTGITVNETLGLSRRERRQLRATLHRQQQNDPARPATLTPTQLAGKLAYLEMLNPAQAQALHDPS